MMVILDLEAGRFQDAAAHLREALQLDTRTGNWRELPATPWTAAGCCAPRPGASPRPSRCGPRAPRSCGTRRFRTWPLDARRRQGPLRQARQALGPDRARAAEERGAAMTMATAAEYALLLTDPGPPQPAAPGPGTLSARERELVTLVAQGRTDAQIAAQLYISIRTVRSHLDRIRDKTGCRRRADLTRLALSAELDLAQARASRPLRRASVACG